MGAAQRQRRATQADARQAMGPRRVDDDALGFLAQRRKGDRKDVDKGVREHGWKERAGTLRQIAQVQTDDQQNIEPPRIEMESREDQRPDDDRRGAALERLPETGMHETPEQDLLANSRNDAQQQEQEDEIQGAVERSEGFEQIAPQFRERKEPVLPEHGIVEHVVQTDGAQSGARERPPSRPTERQDGATVQAEPPDPERGRCGHKEDLAQQDTP